MIVKFDHISYSCKIDMEQETRNLFEGYEVQFHEVGLINMPMKYSYMHNKQEKHNIMLLSKAGAYPIEITAYESCMHKKEESKYVLKEELIEIYSRNPQETETFFKLLGMKKMEDGIMSYKAVLDEKPINIKVLKSEKEVNILLDEEGWGSLAFVVDNAKRQRQILIDSKYECSEIEELVVNNKNLKIFFTNSPTGEIIEFIGLR